jgi:hypothetical protein
MEPARSAAGQSAAQSGKSTHFQDESQKFSQDILLAPLRQFGYNHSLLVIGSGGFAPQSIIETAPIRRQGGAVTGRIWLL